MAKKTVYEFIPKHGQLRDEVLLATSGADGYLQA